MKPAPFALLPRMDAVTKPLVFPDLDALAAHIERQRGGQGLELVEVEDMHHQWRSEGGGQGIDAPDARDRGVQVWTLDLGQNRDRCLGWAWLNGGGLETLRDGLRRAGQRPTPRPVSHGGLMADSSALHSRLARQRVLGVDAFARVG